MMTRLFRPITSYTGILLLLCLTISSKGQDCEPLTIEDLGSTTTPSQDGFIAGIIDSGNAIGTSSVQVFAMNTVCASIPTQRGKFRFTSVVANYTDSNRPSSGVIVSQFELMCDDGTWMTSFFNSRSVTTPNDATFDTPLRTDCAFCVKPTSVVLNPERNYDSITHCVICEGCTGLNQCNITNMCCNYYNDDQCLAQCPVSVSTANVATNECVCNPGLTGGQCEDINECSAAISPCENNGSCTNTPGSFTCQCDSMYTGDLCEEDVDECTNGVAQCMNGATCNNTFGSFECLCPPTYTGLICDTDVDECTNGIAQCMNGATCANSDGGFACVCPPEFTGVQCEIDVDECALGTHDCMNQAVCSNTHGGYNCTCTPQFTGTLCETDVDECTTSNPCENGAECVNVVGSFSCNCASGFEGMTCENDIDECSAAINPCKNNGMCINNVGNFSCNCASGFEGMTCENDIDECDDTPCGVGGQCVNTVGSFSCNCESGFEGAMCDNIDECASVPNPCSNGGTCTDTIGSFNCMCMPGFTGETCVVDIDECAMVPSPCSNDATCINNLGSYKCNCLAGFEGDSCEDDIDECQRFTQFCENGGSCENTFGSFICTCPPGVTGLICDTDIDECAETPNLCQNSGVCLNTLGSFSCNCPSGYTGDFCETDIDECVLNTPCQNDGSCTNLAGSYSCDCAPGWTGDNCDCDVDVDECNQLPNLCQNGGTCINTQGSYQCQCGLRWNGQNCEDCSIIDCVRCTGLNAVCQECAAGFDISFTSAIICVPQLPCVPECVRGECINGQCNCETGFTGNDCSEVCTNRIAGCETCSVSGDTLICDQCQAGFIKDGNECKTTECSVPFCEECENDVSVCKKCLIGYEKKEAQAVCTIIGERPALTSFEIIGIIVGIILFAIVLLAFIACIISAIYRAKERPKMKKTPKKTVFQKYAANTNPLYLDSKRTVGLAAAHGGVSAEGMMSIEYSGPGYDSRDEHDDFSSLPVVDEAAEDQYEPDEWDTTGSLSHHKQSLGDRDGIDESKEED